MMTFGKLNQTVPVTPIVLPVAAKPAPVPVPTRRDEPRHEGAVSLRDRVVEQIDPSKAATVSREVLQAEIAGIIHEIANKERLGMSGRDEARLADDIADDMTGYGPISAFLLDDSITDIMVNGPTNVFVERNGKLERTAVRFRNGDHVAQVGQKIASQIGRRVDESSPICDARLPDGSRVNIILPPLAIDGASISIRKFSTHRYDLDAMVNNGSMTPAVARLLEIAARCRCNILVSGGTGSGKTTLLNAMSQFIDHGERIVTIEDAAELKLRQPHIVRLETRPPSLEGTGQITQRDLVRNALRMRPDRIIVGEVRGEEAFDMLQAMNTGHDGSISTVHANTARDALTRVENMVQMGQANLPSRAIRGQIVAALNLIIQVERGRDGQRRVMQISEITGMEGDIITVNDIAKYEFEREDAEGRLLGRYTSTQSIPRFKDRLAYYGLERAWADNMRQL